MLERQARRALDRQLMPGEAVRGFTYCEWDNGRRVVIAFANLAVSKGFFAFTDERVFLIPTRVRDLMSVPFSQLDAVQLRGSDEFVSVKMDQELPSLDMILADASVGRALLDRWTQHVSAGRGTFELVFRTPDFGQRVLEEMDKQLAKRLPFDFAVEAVAMATYRLTLELSRNKAVASAGAFAADYIARSHPGAPAAPVGQALADPA